MELQLSDAEIRVLGSLMEKAVLTPENYPLSLNALTNACNQKSSRDPVVAYDESTVSSVVETLIDKGLVEESALSRVPKYDEKFTRERKLVGGEIAAICVLLLRGPQTAGEIRTRTARLYNFQTLEETLETLSRLQEWGYVQRLPRTPGHKESRYSHLLDGGVRTEAAPDDPEGLEAECAATDNRLSELEEAVDQLRTELAALKNEFQAFRTQFE